MHSILLVEDNVDTHNLVKRTLGSVHLHWAKSLKEASLALQEHAFDLILLDIMLPDGDGYRLCSLLRADELLNSVPVILLTAKTSVADKILGFSIGADDYVTKPFEPLELKARIEARLKKRERNKTRVDVLTFTDMEINRGTQKVYVDHDGQRMELDLTPLEFKLLGFLAREPQRIWSRDEILNSVWGEAVHVYNRSVDTHISKLRRKLGPKSHYIKSSHGAGYSFAPPERHASGAMEFDVPQPKALGYEYSSIL